MKRYNRKELKEILSIIRSKYEEGVSIQEIANHLQTKTHYRPANIPSWSLSCVQQLASHHRISNIRNRKIRYNDTATSYSASDIFNSGLTTKIKAESTEREHVVRLMKLILTSPISDNKKTETLKVLSKDL